MRQGLTGNIKKERNMKKCLILLLMFSLVLTASPVAVTQTNQPEQSTTNEKVLDWQGMYGVMPGTKLVVELKSGRKGEGEAVSLAGSKLTLSAKGHTYVFEQSGIQRIYGFKGRSRSKTARIGAGIGMFLGTFIGVGMAIRNESRPNCVHSDSERTPAVAGLFLGTLAGAGVGALFGGKRRKELLYEAK
jgi:hypothetical protein